MEEIVISGISCQFPGAPDVDAFWRLIRTNEIAVRPAGRGGGDFREEMAGGYVAGVDEFDAGFFGVSVREAQLMDPQQRLLLQNAWRAIEDAGVAPQALRGSRTGVFVGAMASDWSQIYLLDTQNLNSQTVTGNGHALLANRISYYFDFKGPSLAVDSACSSALFALHYALSSLRAGECDQALVAGVNVIATPILQMFYQRAGLAAPDGRCKPFSRDGDGIVRAEGVGVVLLQRGDAARQSYARVLGSSINHDGQSNGLTAPNRFAQEALLRQTYETLGVEPSDIAYVECHGTGTQLGDRMELRALQSVFGAGERAAPLAIGSVKGLIGHAEAAAGLAGLVKLALMLRHGHVPASLYAEAPNPALGADSCVQLPSAPYDLPTDIPVRMGLSGLGLGGANAHVVLEGRPWPQPEPSPQGVPALFLLSGHSPEGLAAQVERLAEHVEEGRPDLAAMAARCHAVKSRHLCRAALVADHPEQLWLGLRALALEGPDADERPSRRGPAVLLFPGEGAERPGMGRALFERHRAGREALEACDAAFQPLLGRSLIEMMSDPRQGELLKRSTFAQPALFAVEYAMARLWLSFGAVPRAVIGCGVGEYAAACVAGALDLPGAAYLVATRAALIDMLAEGGAMLAAQSDRKPFEPLLRELGDQLSVAAINGRRDIVLSGSVAAIQRAIQLAQALNIVHRRLRVRHAFHSPLMAVAEPAFREHGRTVVCREPRLIFVSTLTGGVVSGAPDPEHWVRHLTEPVRFHEAMEALEEAVRPAVAIEAAPGDQLGALVARSGACARTLWLPTARDGADERSLLEGLAVLYRAGAPLRLDALYENAPPCRLPSYVFSRDRYWPPESARKPEAARVAPPQTTAGPSASRPIVRPSTAGYAPVPPRVGSFAAGSASMPPIVRPFAAGPASMKPILRPAANGSASAPPIRTQAAPSGARRQERQDMRQETRQEMMRPDMTRHDARRDMQPPDMAEVVRSQVAAVLGWEVSAVRPNHRFSEDLGLDSVNLIELMERLNRSLPKSVELTISDAMSISTVSDLSRKMETLVCAQTDPLG